MLEINNQNISSYVAIEHQREIINVINDFLIREKSSNQGYWVITEDINLKTKPFVLCDSKRFRMAFLVYKKDISFDVVASYLFNADSMTNKEAILLAKNIYSRKHLPQN